MELSAKKIVELIQEDTDPIGDWEYIVIVHTGDYLHQRKCLGENHAFCTFDILGPFRNADILLVEVANMLDHHNAMAYNLQKVRGIIKPGRLHIFPNLTYFEMDLERRNSRGG